MYNYTVQLLCKCLLVILYTYPLVYYVRSQYHVSLMDGLELDLRGLKRIFHSLTDQVILRDRVNTIDYLKINCSRVDPSGITDENP